MTEQDKSAFYQLWGDYHSAYGQAGKLTKRTMELVFNALREYPVQVIERALEAHHRESQYAPRPSDIVSRIEGTMQERAMMAWQMVTHCMAKYGYTQSLVFDDPAIIYALERVGGWEEICKTPNDVLPFRRQEFEKHYALGIKAGVGWGTVPRYIQGWDEKAQIHRWKMQGLPMEEFRPLAGTIVHAKSGRFLESLDALPGATDQEKALAEISSAAVKRVG